MFSVSFHTNLSLSNIKGTRMEISQGEDEAGLADGLGDKVVDKPAGELTEELVIGLLAELVTGLGDDAFLIGLLDELEVGLRDDGGTEVGEGGGKLVVVMEELSSL